MAVAEHKHQQENPLVEGLERVPVPPTTLVIFGGTGDLAHRKLLPAIYNLAHEGALPERFNLIAVSRSEMSDEEYRKMARESIEQYSRRQPDPQVLEKLLEQVRYVAGTFDVDSVFDKLGEDLDAIDREAELTFNRVFYLSTAPTFFALIVKQLGDHGLDKHPKADVRVVIEKPFGTRWRGAELNRQVLSVLDESQVYRIDHYLGKETVQNVLAFRFANGMFEPIWNRNFIDYVQITAAEDLGIGRGPVLRQRGRAARPRAEPHAAAADAAVHGAAGDVRRRRGARREGQGAPRRRRRRRGRVGAGAQYTAGMAEGKEAAATSRRRACRTTRTPRPTSRSARGGQLALGGRADLPAHRQAARRKVTEIAVTLKPVPHLAFKADGSVGVQPTS
jgi:glucose-6-phosphate 1-dehydrogenase